MSEFPHLFQPLDLRHVTLRHRLNFGAHTANMAEAGLPGERHLAYYLERAKGGAAMIVVEPVPVHRTAVLTRGNFRHEDDAIVPHFRAITDACHAEGAVMIHQLYHVGQHGDYMNSFQPYWSPSGLPSYHDPSGTKRMTEADIEETIEAFVQAARRAKESGFDGIELFAAYHAIIDQFWTPWSNRRDDKWGGTFENRMRFSVELTNRIRAEVGSDFIIGMAVSMDPDVEVSLSVEAMQEIAVYHDGRGLADYFTCGTGSYFDFYELIPVSLHDQMLGPPFAKALKDVVTHAVVQAESHIRTPHNAERAIVEGMADMVSIVRGQIADPHLANKAREGRAIEIRPCISCNQMCWGRRHRDYWISCLVNPSAGREFEWGGDRFEAAEVSRRVLVVGGGPAGMEAARVSAERGHTVTLVEATDRLGGQWYLAGRQPSRFQVADHVAWYEAELGRLNVDVRLRTRISAEDVAGFEADVVIVATGSKPATAGFQYATPEHDELPGLDGKGISVQAVLDGTEVGERVLIVDATNDWKGAGTGVLLSERGHTVALATTSPVVAKGLEMADADHPLRQRYARAGGESLTSTVVEEWDDGTALLRHTLTGTTETRQFDSLVVAGIGTPRTGLFDRLTGGAAAGIEVYAIGDCVAARTAIMAIYEGRDLANRL